MSGKSPLRRPGAVFLLGATVLLCSCAGDGGVPEEVLRHNIVGTALLSQQSWEQAQERFRQGLALSPDDPILHVNMAVALLQQARVEEAETHLQRALKADPDQLHAHYNLGLIEKNRGNAQAAAEHFRRVAQADPDDVATRYNLGSALARTERASEAEAEFRAALERNPGHVSTLYALGRLRMQQGDQQQGIEMIQRSQAIRARSGSDSAMGTQYGEQGPYAMGVDYPGAGIVAPEATPVSFGFGPLSPEVAELPGYQAAMREAFRHFYRTRRLSGEPGGQHAPAVGDVDGDWELEFVSLAGPGERSGWSLAFRTGPTQPVDRQQEIELSFPEDWLEEDLVLVDRDHDGDLDLFGCLAGASGSACFLADNDGAGTFTVARDTGVEAGIGAVESGPLRLTFSDFDNDRDVDLLVGGPGGVRVFANMRDGTFADRSDEVGLGARAGAVLELVPADPDKDGWMDLVRLTVNGPSILANRRGRFHPTEPEGLGGDATAGASERHGMIVLDHDNDGLLDIAATAGGALRLYRNLGLGRWRETAVLEREGDERHLIPFGTVDLGRDGDLDLLVEGTQQGVLENTLGGSRRWITVQPLGESDNTFAIGAKVEILAGALRQKFEIVGPGPVHLGLGERERVDAVRFLWPGGVLQDELDLATGEVAEIGQLDRKGTSCPLLYAWRDGEWRFVTDFLGGCAIGYRHGPGPRFGTPDTDEYVLVEGGLTAEDGTVRLRLNNQLEEVIWFDQTELVIVDHPAGTEVYPNERLMPGPPWPEFRLYVARDVRPVSGALEVETGRDVTGLLRERDRRYADGFRKLPFKGYAEMHTLELDLGALPPGGRQVLLLDGWIDYADSTANVGAAQAGLALVPPRLLVEDARGGWRDVSERMGFPAGLPKTMAVDLTGAMPAGASRLRISTNMRIYWDRARVMVGGEDTPYEVRRLQPDTAELREGGFPEESSADGRPPFGYDAGRVERVSPWKVHLGTYTALGDVRPLLTRLDDRFVTTRSGDEIELVFRVGEPAAEGWQRTYLLFADGFGKDMDPNSGAGSEVGPVPFHGMPTYPYGPEVVPPHEPEASGRHIADRGDSFSGAVPLVLKAGSGR